jgi:hypothetical protein
VSTEPRPDTRSAVIDTGGGGEGGSMAVSVSRSRSSSRASKAEDAASETSVLSWGGTFGLWEWRQATLRARWHDKRQAGEARRA